MFPTFLFFHLFFFFSIRLIGHCLCTVFFILLGSRMYFRRLREEWRPQLCYLQNQEQKREDLMVHKREPQELDRAYLITPE